MLSLYEERDRASAEVKRIAEDHLARVEAKIVELEAMKRTLGELVRSCRGDHRPDCPILEDLAGGAGSPAERDTTSDLRSRASSLPESP